MVEIKIFLYVITSFFGIETGQIAAENTTITVNPKKHQVEIFHTGLFAVIETEKDEALTQKTCEKIFNIKKGNAELATELKEFSVKKFKISTKKSTAQSRLVLKYSEPNDLRALGIWYNAEKGSYAYNQAKELNVSSEDGKLDKNYWTFDGHKAFSFMLRPYDNVPERFLPVKRDLKKFLEQAE